MIVLIQKPADGGQLAIQLDADSVTHDDNGQLPVCVKKGEAVVARFAHIMGYALDDGATIRSITVYAVAGAVAGAPQA